MNTNINLLDEYEVYLKGRQQQSDITVKGYLSSVKLFFKYINKLNLIKQITMEDIDKINKKDFLKFKMYLQEQNKKGNTISTRFSALNSFFKFIHKQYEHNSAKVFIDEITDLKRHIRIISKKKNVLSLEECQRVLEHTKNDYELEFRERNYLLLSLFLGNGLRLSETVNLKESNFDLVRKVVYLNGELTKGNKKAELPLNQGVINAYNDYINWKRKSKYNDTDYLFVSRINHSNHLSERQAQTIISELVLNAGINKKISPHCLRATFATLLNEHGANPYEIKDQLRHSSITTTSIYININNERMKVVNNMNPINF